MSDFHTSKTVLAKKEHKCVYCSKPIAKGELYQKWSGRYDGAFYSEQGHLDCVGKVGKMCGVCQSNQYYDECSLNDQIDCLNEAIREEQRKQQPPESGKEEEAHEL